MLNYKLLQQWYYVIYTSLDSTVRCYLNNGLCFPIIPEEVPFQNIIKENSIFLYNFTIYTIKMISIKKHGYH